MWAVQAKVGMKYGDDVIYKDIPLFYLNSKVQGITDSGHAVRIAESIINPHNLFHSEHVFIHVIKMS